MLAILGLISAASYMYNLNGIKSKTVGDGQHGAARFATNQELSKTFRTVKYEPKRWRTMGQEKREKLKLPQGIIVGCKNKHKLVYEKREDKKFPLRVLHDTYAMVDTGDVHAMVVGAAGCGKTSFWLYPNLE